MRTLLSNGEKWSKVIFNNQNTLCRGVAATTQLCFSSIPFINGTVLSVNILVYRTVMLKQELFLDAIPF